MINATIFSYHPAPYRDPVFESFHEQYGAKIEYKIYFANSVDFGHKYQILEGLNANHEVLNIDITSVKNIKSYVRNYKLFAKIINRDKSDVVLIPGHSDTFNLPLLHYCILHKIPFILTSDSISLNKNGFLRNAIRRMIDTIFVKKSSSIYVPGKAGRKFMNKLGALDEAIFEGAYCLDCRKLDRDAKDCLEERDSIRSSLGITREEVLFLFAGRFIDVCDFSTMLSAFNDAQKKNNNIRLLLIGDGKEKEKIEKLIADKHIEGIILHDFVPIREIGKYYVAADAYLMTYIWGNYSLACIQAAICKLPIITTDTLGAASDVVVHHVTGILTPKQTVDATANAIIHISNLSNEERQRMGELGRKLAMERTPEWAADNLYKAILYANNK